MKFPLVDTQAPLLADTIEAAAMRDLYRVAPPSLGAYAVNVSGATVLVAPKLPFTLFNRVIGLGNAMPARQSDINDIDAVYASSKVRPYWIHVGSAAQPQSLSSKLAEQGFTLATRPTWAKLLRGVEPASSLKTPLVIREATTADAPAVGEVVCMAFGLPPDLSPWFAALIGRTGWRVWVAERDAQVVATGSLFIQGKIGWLGIGATLVQHRGLGAQTSLIGTRIQAAADSGCCLLAAETGEPSGNKANPSLSNLRRAGFIQVGSRSNYVSPETLFASA